MKKIYCAYGDEPFYEKLLVTEESALSVGKVDEFYTFRKPDLNIDNFYENNKEILTQQPGGGFWAWKPWVILKTMEKVSDGDIVVHTSTGMKIIANLDPLYEITMNSRDNRMLFDAPLVHGSHLHRQYTKRDTFIAMDCDTPEYYEMRMLHAGFCVFMKTPKNIAFLEEWLKFTTMKLAIWDFIDPLPPTCGLPNLPGFGQHRWDQSVLSLLSQKHGRELYRDPSQFGLPPNDNPERFSNSPYGQLLYQYD